MKLGLHLANFTYGVEAPGFAAKLDEIVSGADAAGFDRRRGNGAVRRSASHSGR